MKLLGPSAAGAALLLLAGCATGSSAGTTTPTAKATVLGLEAGLTVADNLALNYVSLPACTGSNGPLCSNPTVVAQIKAADNAAYGAVTAAQAAVDADATGTAATTVAAVSAAATALQALQTAVASLPKQGS